MKSCLLSVVAVLALLAGCVEEEKDISAPKEDAAKVAPEAVKEAVKPVAAKPVVKEVKAAPVADKALVTVNGEAIMMSVVDERIEPQLAMMKQMGREATPEMIDNFRKRVLDGMIRETLVEAQVKSEGIKISKADVDAKLDEIAKQRNTTVADLIASAAPQGYTEETIRGQITMGMSFDKLMDAKAASENLKVTEADAKKFYDENAAQFSSPGLVKTSHILAGGRGFDSFDDAKKAEAKGKIDEAKKKLDAGGNFEELAKEYSDCPSGAEGGDLKVYISDKGEVDGRPSMDVTFSKAAHTLEVGGVTDVVTTPFGYHLIKVTDKKAAETKTFDDVKAELIEQQEGQKMNEFATSYIEKLVADAKIVYPDAPKVEAVPAIKAVPEK